MLEAKIQVDREIAAKGYKKALWLTAVKDISYYHAVRLLVVWLLISIVNGLYDQPFLNSKHGIALVGLWIVVSVYDYLKWLEQIGKTEIEGYFAKLDEYGVTIKRETFDEIYSWELYKSYKEYDDYIQINFTNGGMSLIPKTHELFEVIEFTKTKISPE